MTLLSYARWIFPDAAEFFFPVSKNKKLSFAMQWSSIRPVVRILIWEAICFSFASTMWVFFSLTYGLLLVTGFICDAAIPGLPLASSSKRGEKFRVTVLDGSNHKLTPGFPAIIRGFMKRSEPIIIKNLPKETFSALAPNGPYAPSPTEAMVKSGAVIYTTYFLPRALAGFGQWIRKNVGRPVLYMVRLSSASYTAAHMDGISSQVYYVARGRKRVWICPRQYNHLLQFQASNNSVKVPGSDTNSPDPLKWIKTVPGVWWFELEEGDVLMFNNAACVHKFESGSENPEVFSLRILNSDLSPVLARHHVFNWEQARVFANFIMNRNKMMEIKY